METLLNILYCVIGSIGMLVLIPWINSVDKENEPAQSENKWREVGFNELDNVYKAIAIADVADSDYWLGK